jgi:RNA polymerase sigma factor FliA
MSTAGILTPTSPPEEPLTGQSDERLDAYRPAYEAAAEDELIQQHLPLVKTVVGRMAMNLPSHVDVEDLQSCGLIGLLNAIRHFDPHGGSSFESYARVRIRGAVLDELRRLDWVPRSVHEKARKVQNTLLELEQRKGRLPTDSEMAIALRVSPHQYEQWLEEIRPATFVCLDRTEGEDEVQGHDWVADPAQEHPLEDMARRERVKFIAERLKQLPIMQRKVLALYYDEGLRLREIAEVFGVTESRICQIHAQAILAIKSSLQNEECAPDASLPSVGTHRS